MVAYVSNPNTLRGPGGRILWAQELKTSLGNIARLCILNKIKKKERKIKMTTRYHFYLAEKYKILNLTMSY